MIDSEISNTARSMLYFIACEINNIQVKPQYIKNINLNALYKLANSHSLTAIVCMALENAEAFSNNPNILKPFQQDKDKAIRKLMLLAAERQKLLAFMEKSGIWYLPLKGSVLSELYPKLGMRQMSDNDILFDSEHRTDIKNYFEQNGYNIEHFEEGNHDVYVKQPIYNFEMHVALFHDYHDKLWLQYYENVKDRLVPDEGKNFGYHFNDEDFYIYTVVHIRKHYVSSGTGLRSLMDIYIYLHNKGESLDWSYIDGELNKLDMVDFERDCRLLSQKLFSDPDSFWKISISDNEEEMLQFFIGSGTYGNTKNRIERKIKELNPQETGVTTRSKLLYIKNRIFPDMEWIRTYKPKIAKHKCLIPFYIIFRGFRALLFRRRKITSELRVIKNMNDGDEN